MYSEKSNICKNKTKAKVSLCAPWKLRPGRSGVQIPARTKYLPLPQNVQTVSGAHPAPYSVGTRSFFPGVKRPGR